MAHSQVRLQPDHAADQTNYRFDVVSIRPSAKEGFSHWGFQADGYSATNVTAQQLIFDAYQTADPNGFNHIISLDQIRGLPKWGDSEQFDLIAKVDEQTMSRFSGLSAAKLKKLYGTMLQPILEERFHLVAHHEKREQSVLVLTIAQGGSKLAVSNTPFEKSSLNVGRSRIRAKGMTLEPLIETLTQSQQRIVVDQTQLTGVYDFDLSWSLETSTTNSIDDRPLSSALKEQLGLELTPSRGPVDYVVVTRLENPTLN